MRSAGVVVSSPQAPCSLPCGLRCGTCPAILPPLPASLHIRRFFHTPAPLGGHRLCTWHHCDPRLHSTLSPCPFQTTESTTPCRPHSRPGPHLCAPHRPQAAPRQQRSGACSQLPLPHSCCSAATIRPEAPLRCEPVCLSHEQRRPHLQLGPSCEPHGSRPRIGAEAGRAPHGSSAQRGPADPVQPPQGVPGLTAAVPLVFCAPDAAGGWIWGSIQASYCLL